MADRAPCERAAGRVGRARQTARIVWLIEQTQHVRGQRLVVGNWRQQPMCPVDEDGGNAASFGGHHRQAARKRFEDRRRHVVDVRTLNVDIVIRVRRCDVGRPHPSREGDAMKPEIDRERAECRLLRSTAHQCECRVRPTVLYQPECTNRCRHVVMRLEVARRQQAWLQRIAISETEDVQVDNIGHDRRSNAESAEHVGQEA